MSPVFQAHAKINLGLRVLGKRPDGFHNISTIFHRIGLSDEIELEQGNGITVETTSPEVPTDHTNICHRAATLLRERLGISAGVKVTIHKNIPVGAGLGGGSTDAASVLLHLPKFWGVKADASLLQEIALQLGSDVPYFLGEGAALGTGRGEALDYFPLNMPWHILLCNPRIHVSTAWAYRHVRPSVDAGESDLRAIVQRGMNDPEYLREHLKNDFEEPVFAAYPEIRNVKETMYESGALFALMSGSGSSVYGLWKSKDAMTAASGQFRGMGLFVHVTSGNWSGETLARLEQSS